MEQYTVILPDTIKKRTGKSIEVDTFAILKDDIANKEVTGFVAEANDTISDDTSTIKEDENVEKTLENEGEEEEDVAPVKKAVGDAMKGSATTAAASTISLKGQLPVAGKSSEVAHDALGGGVKDAHGKGEQITQPTATNAAGLAATLQMKPSFSSPQVPQMTNEQLAADITAIFGSQELSEEFVQNAASIYEAAVTAKVESITEALVEQFEEKLVEEVETVKGALVEQLDD
jgi:hypothetical protein